MTNLFSKMADLEKDFFSSQVLCPVLKNKPIRVRIAGVILNMQVVRPTNYEGWGVFELPTAKTARLVREPSATERQAYLNLFPALRLIVCRRVGDVWYGIPANLADTRFKITGLVPIALATEVQLFDVVQTRFDGQNCWFDTSDERHDLRLSSYLRQELVKLTEPSELSHSGLSPELCDAYLLAYGPALEADIEAKKDRVEERIKDVLRRAGAKYRSYLERTDSYTVEYMVGRERHRSTISKDNLEVRSAGICLSGNDRHFDLQSLVGVIREGQRARRIVRVGDNTRPNTDYEDDYE